MLNLSNRVLLFQMPFGSLALVDSHNGLSPEDVVLCSP